MKLAFFVEGFTEQLLIKELALMYYGPKNLSYFLYRLRGGNKVAIKVSLEERHDATNTDSELIFNIYDCGGEGSIRSMVNHQRNSLYKNNFLRIVSIRDVIPLSRNQIPKLKMDFPYQMAQKPIPTVFLLCIMETEAWFIAETNHFLKISPILTIDHINDRMGININTVDVESIDTPAVTLNEIYSLAGETYEKTIASISRTINSLDLVSLYFIAPERIPCLQALISEIENC